MFLFNSRTLPKILLRVSRHFGILNWHFEAFLIPLEFHSLNQEKEKENLAEWCYRKCTANAKVVKSVSENEEAVKSP